MVLILFIFIKRNEIKPLLGEKSSTVGAYLGFIASFLFSIYCYRHLPLIDFRPYAIGSSIPEGMKLPPNSVKDSVVMVFIYEKDGKQIELSLDKLAGLDDSYKFVDRKDKVIREGDKPKIHDFTVTGLDGSDLTDDVLSMKTLFVLVSYDINKADTKVQSKINDFVALCQLDGVGFIGLTASSLKEVDDFRHKYNSIFDYYFTDGTTLKTIIRSNPGLVLLQNGVVKGLWHYNDFPTFDEVKKEFHVGIIK